MATIRQQNWLGQQRVDVPHLRSVESAVAADFDILAGRIIAGETACIVKGFNIVLTDLIGNPASQALVNVEDGVLAHYLASESGTIFTSPATATTETLSSSNAVVTGSFTPGTTNYVGLDFRRTADSDTTDLVNFTDALTLEEYSRNVPLARTLKCQFVISTTEFSQAPTVLPIAILTTDSANNVTAVTDARNLLFRLGSGGSSPDTVNSYSWPEGREEETSTILDNFVGGDKSIGSLKEWMDAVMTSVWEAKGGRYWYSPTADRNVRLVADKAVAYAFNGQNVKYVSPTLSWTGLTMVFEGAGGTVYYNNITNGTSTLADGECLYVDIVRTSNANISAYVTSIATLNSSSPTTPGARHMVAWRDGDSIYVRDFSYLAEKAAGSVFGSHTTALADSTTVSETNAYSQVLFATDNMGVNLTAASSEFQGLPAGYYSAKFQLSLGVSASTGPVTLYFRAYNTTAAAQVGEEVGVWRYDGAAYAAGDRIHVNGEFCFLLSVASSTVRLQMRLDAATADIDYNGGSFTIVRTAVA